MVIVVVVLVIGMCQNDMIFSTGHIAIEMV